MLLELRGMELAPDRRKLQEHETPLFPCSAYFTDWHPAGPKGVPWHWHKEIELMVISHGSARVWLGDQTALLQAGDGYFCNQNTLHSIQMEGCDRSGVHSLVFDPVLISGGMDTVFHKQYVSPLCRAANLPGQILFQSEAWQAEILSYIRQAHHCYKAGAFGYEFEVRSLLSQAWLQFIRHHQSELERPKTESGLDTQRVKQMISYIQQHYGQPIAVQDLADAASICKRECQRCFQQVLHISPTAYLQQYRIQMAAILLRDTEDSILDIGLAVGFLNPSHFSRVFRTQMGCSPRAYRNRLSDPSSLQP